MKAKMAMKLRSKLGISSEYDEQQLLEAQNAIQNGKVLEPHQAQAVANRDKDTTRMELNDEKRALRGDWEDPVLAIGMLQYYNSVR